MTETETKWSERVRAWRSSGQTASEFAQGREFEASTLRYWASRLRKETASTERESAPTVTPAPRVRLLRVTRTPAAAREPLVVLVGAARIEVGAGFDHALLRELIDALGPRHRYAPPHSAPGLLLSLEILRRARVAGYDGGKRPLRARQRISLRSKKL